MFQRLQTTSYVFLKASTSEPMGSNMKAACTVEIRDGHSLVIASGPQFPVILNFGVSDWKIL